MKVRSRLVLAFAYVLTAVIVALTIPLAINLRGRAKAELETQALVNVQTIAAGIGREGIADPTLLQRLVVRYSNQLGPDVRVLVTDAEGIVLADSETPPQIGENYATADRGEMLVALDPANPQPTSIIRHSDTLEADIMAAAAPIIDDGLQGAVRVTQSVQQVTDSVRRVTVGLVVVGFSGLLAGLMIAYALAGSLARPLSRLADAAARLGKGELSTRAGDIGGASEISDLAHSFDEMADRLEHTVQAQREFVANASHQLRTPLTGMKLRLESAIADAPSEDLKRRLQAADTEVDRLSETVNRLLTMARQVEEGEPTRVDLGEAASSAVERWRERAEQLNATLETRGSGGSAQANPTDLDQALDNLLDNAIAYAPGLIRIETGATFVAVTDSGPGIAPDELERVTDRFYRGRGAPAGGTGLGLAIARELTEKWGGTLEVSAPEGGGTRVEIRLRAAGPSVKT